MRCSGFMRILLCGTVIACWATVATAAVKLPALISTDSYVRPKVTIPIVFTMEPPLRAVPSVIALGTVFVGDAGEQRTQLVSHSGEPVTAQIEYCPSECSITFDNKKNPTEMVVAIKLKKIGIWQGIVKLRAKDASRTQTIEIKCVAYVREPSR